MASANTIVGQYGLIPEDHYIRKHEKTILFEDPENLSGYQRNILKDTGCDAPILESDEPRRNHESKSFLNLRYGGARTTTDPYLPDGTFLDYSHFEKDPRSIMLEPDMRRMVELSREREKFVMRYPDADDSIPESGINPRRMVDTMAHALPFLKNRMISWDESFDSRSTKGASIPTKLNHCKDITTVDSQILDLNSATCANRQDYVDSTSMQQLGFRSGVDHRFKISRYGQVRAASKFSDQGLRKGMIESNIDHEIPVPYEGVNITRDIALLIANPERRKWGLHLTGLHTIFNEIPGENRNITRKLAHDDLEMIRKYILLSGAKSSHEGLRSENNNTNISHPALDNRITKMVINPHIIEYMSDLINKKLAPRDQNDLRENIVSTAVDNGIYVEQLNVNSGVLESDMLQNRNSIDQVYRDNSKEIVNYKSMQAEDMPSKIVTHNAEVFLDKSYEQDQRIPGTLNSKMFDIGTYNSDRDFSELSGLTKDRLAAPLGKKYMVRHMQNEHFDNNMTEILNK